mgnify:CR=1 FL=1
MTRYRSRLVLTLLLLAGLALGGATARFGVLHAATCVGATPCNACKNCSACAHCKKRGGTCGVCKKVKTDALHETR